MVGDSVKKRVMRLNVYAEKLKNRLRDEVPPRYKNNPEAFKEMVSIDLKKTLTTIEKLSK